MWCICAILSSVACPALQYFSTLSLKRPDCREMLWDLKFLFRFSLQICQTFLTVRRIEQDTAKNVYLSSCEVPFFFCQIVMKLKFCRKIFEKYISNFMKIYPVGAELFHTDGEPDRRTGMTKLIVSFRNFANVPKNKWRRASTYDFTMLRNNCKVTIRGCIWRLISVA